MGARETDTCGVKGGEMEERPCLPPWTKYAGPNCKYISRFAKVRGKRIRTQRRSRFYST